MKTLNSILGDEPEYIGLIGLGNGYHGVVFRHDGQYTLVAWAVGHEMLMDFRQEVSVIDTLTGDVVYQDKQSLSVTFYFR